MTLSIDQPIPAGQDGSQGEGDASAPVSFLRVENLWVRKGGLRRHKWILKDVSLDVKQGEFVAIIGPNGAGKTKLLEAILGDRPYAGQVALFNQDLYADPERWLQHVGWVPSYNVLHDSLRAEQALLLIARLRLPGRSEEALRTRIRTLLDQLEFPEGRRNAFIRDLSSGERKRLDLCAELLNSPPLLILDEPTTNLDPDAERSLMELLRNRSWGKRQAVVVVTHTLQSLYYCDRVIFLAKGRVRAQGTYDEALAQLERSQLEAEMGEAAELPVRLEAIQTKGSGKIADDASRWAEIYRKSRRYENEPPGELPQPAAPLPPPDKIGRQRQRSWLHELRVLLKRNWLLFINNLPALGLYLLLGPFSGLLSRIVLRDQAFIQDADSAAYSSVFDTTDARQAIFIIALVVTLLGLIGSFLDVTKERPLYRYERVKGLSPWAYLLSKWIILTGLVGLAAPSFLMIMLTFQGQTMPNALYVLLTLYLACIAAVTLGLAISAAASSERTATGLLGIVVVFHLFFSGGVDFNARFQAFLERISVLAASHWAAEGISTSIQLYCWAANPRFQDFASLGHLLSVWLYLVVYILIALVLGFVALRMQDTWFPWRTRLVKALFNSYVWTALPLVLVAFSWGMFLEQRSQDYYALRVDQDTLRVTNFAFRNDFQSVNGYLSQSTCPLPTPLPPAQVMVAIPPTLAATPVQNEAATQPAAPAIPGTTSTPLPTLPAGLLPTDETFQPLPVGKLLIGTPILFGPEHPGLPLEMLPEGTSFTLLGKDFDGSWFRVKEEATGRELVGWIAANTTDLPASRTGEVAHPPACAIPRVYLEGNAFAPSAEWTSDVAGHVVVVIDLFRDQAGDPFPASQLFLSLNDQRVDTYPIKPTRQSFVFRGLAVDVRLNLGTKLRFFMADVALPGVTLHLRASIFFVPAGCGF